MLKSSKFIKAKKEKVIRLSGNSSYFSWKIQIILVKVEELIFFSV